MRQTAALPEVIHQDHDACCELEHQLQAEHARNALLRSELEDERTRETETKKGCQESIEGLRSALAKLRHGLLRQEDLAGLQHRLDARAHPSRCQLQTGWGSETAVRAPEHQQARRCSLTSSAASECWDEFFASEADVECAAAGASALQQRLSTMRRHRRAQSSHMYLRTCAVASAKHPGPRGASPSWRATLDSLFDGAVLTLGACVFDGADFTLGACVQATDGG